MKAVGARLPRYDGVAHVTGRTRYVDDVRVPGMLWAKALRSPIHRGRTSRAGHQQGASSIRASGRSSRTRTSRRTSTVTSRRSACPPTSRSSQWTRFASRGSRSRWSPPRTRTRPARPSELIDLELEEQEPLLDVRKAFDPDAPQIHPWGNWYPHFEDEHGPPRRSARVTSTRAFDQADVIVQGVYRPAAIEHVAARDPDLARASRSRTAG